MRQMRKKKKGFTLLELLVVISIIIILTALTVPLFSSLMGNSGTNAVQRMIQAAMYKARSMSTSQRKKIALVFERDWNAGPAENPHPFTGRITLWDFQTPFGTSVPPQTKIAKLVGEDMHLPKGTFIEDCPYIVMFYNNGLAMYQNLQPGQPKGSLEYYETNELSDVDQAFIGPYADVQAADFKTYVVNPLRDGQQAATLPGGLRSWDIKVRSNQNNPDACYMNVLTDPGRIGKYTTGDAEVTVTPP